LEQLREALEQLNWVAHNDAAQIETPEASDIAPPERAATTVYRTLRDTALARRVKQIHNWECQICGHFIVLPDGSRYAEVHHIQPLGQPHDGKDVESNVMCVCPNHHAELDYGVRRIDVSGLRIREGHVIGPAYVDYHNGEIFGRVNC
jgi:predicted restriction endonuclease